MGRIRVALGDVQSMMLRDILTQITDQQADMVFVGQLRAPLMDASAAQKPDVLICEIPANDLPAVCQELFSSAEPPVIVGLAREGRDAAVCIANAGAAQLMSMIRGAVLNAGEAGEARDRIWPTALRPAAEPAPYRSNADCLNDQLQILDLALMAAVDAFEATVWHESAQRWQGLAISPDEVRALLQGSGSMDAQRPADDLERRRLRLQALAAARIALTPDEPESPPFVRLIRRFGLDPFEQFCVIAGLALAVDRNKYGKTYAFLQDDVTRKQPSLDLLLRLHPGLDDTTRWDAARAFDATRPLMRLRLLRLALREAGELATPFGRRVELDDRIGRFLLGLEDLGPELEDFTAVGRWDAGSLKAAHPRALEDRLIQLVGEVQGQRTGAPPNLVVHVHGRDGTGRRSLVAAICGRLGLRILRVDAARLAGLPTATLDDALVLLAREALLAPTAICIEQLDALLDDDASARAFKPLAGALKGLGPVTFLIGHRAWSPEGLLGDGVFQSVALDLPDAAEARRIWARELALVGLAPELGGAEGAAAVLAGRFRLSPGQIHDAVATARTRSLWDNSEGAPLTLEKLYAGAREQCGHRLATLARHVTSGFGWDDLILPPKQRSQLQELETSIRNASGVLEDWDFQSRLPYGRGITALFSGPSGTGKTMAAGILAHELGLDLYTIDLSRVVSKYIGETEKNLDRIFREAEDANAMLFFDEADALFGKRSVIKDAHDRYANIEIAYLLQKMEERLGATILATNLIANLDDAFLRRIRFSIEFVLPEYAQRLAIWRSSLPKEILLAEDVDLPALATRLNVSGGSIMNVCVTAASLAYQPGGAIGMRHFSIAAKRELQKLGYQYDEAAFAADAPATAAAGR
jgi:AAA+ superfamily predicted ATPase